MSFPSVFGLPAHPLIVHATVVLVPLAALAVLLHAFWPRARARLGFVTLALAVLSVVLVPLSTSSGEQLQGMVGDSRLVHEHAELADQLLPWVLGLLLAAVLLTARDLFERRHPRTQRLAGTRLAQRATAPVLVGVLAVVAVAGTTQQVIRIGHSGAKAAWHGVSASNAGGAGDHDGR